MFKLLAIAMLLSVVDLGKTLPHRLAEEHHTRSVRSANIMGGQVTDIKDAFYVVAITVINPQNRTKTRTCAGSIISDYWVLTAAQCCISTDPADYSVLTSTADLTSGGYVYNVDSVLPHENFTNSFGITRNDIAIIKVREYIRPSRIQQRVILSSEDPESLLPSTGVVVGWGPSESNTADRFLRRVNVSLICNSCCEEQFGSGITSNGRFCAFSPQHRHVCNTNAGNPLTLNTNYLVGIASFGTPCDSRSEDTPFAIYTDVHHFSSWIRRNTDN